MSKFDLADIIETRYGSPILAARLRDGQITASWAIHLVAPTGKEEARMRYLANDGTVYDDMDECLRHESFLRRKPLLAAEVNTYLDLLPWPSNPTSKARQRSRTRNIIMDWLLYDTGLHGARYGLEFDDRLGAEPPQPEGPLVDAEFHEVEPGSEVESAPEVA